MEELEKIEHVEVICGDCPIEGMIVVPAPKIKPKLFNINFYQKVMLQCPTCGKTSKPYYQKLIKEK